MVMIDQATVTELYSNFTSGGDFKGKGRECSLRGYYSGKQVSITDKKDVV